MTNQEPTLLRVQDIHAYYGNIHALKGVSLEVNEKEIVALIGSNGAGKSTLLNTVSGILRSKQGSIYFEGSRIDQLSAHKIVDLGISQVPEGRKIFSRLSVIENLEMGAFVRKDRGEVAKDMEAAFELFPRLRERRQQVAGTLSGGEQQMLAIARALMAFQIATRGYVIQTGSIALEDSTENLSENEMVQKLYLGIEVE